MCPPQSVKIVSTPSFFRALAARWPPEMTTVSVLFLWRVSVAVVVMARPSSILRDSGTPSDRQRLELLGLDPRLLHMVVKLERVLADQPFGQVGIACLQGPDDVGVVDDRANRPIALGHRT